MSTLRKITVVILISVLLGLYTQVSFGQERVTVTFWNVWGGARIPLMKEIIDDFEAKHPNIKIDSIVIPQDGMNQKYLTAIAGGDPPDVIMLNRNQIALFGENKALIPLDKYARRDGLKLENIFYEAELKISKWKGQTLVLPNATGSGWSILFWNKKMFKDSGLDPNRAPRTWQEYTEYARKLTVKKGNVLDRLGGTPTTTRFAQWLLTNNGKLLTADGKKALFGTKEGLDTLKWLLSFADNVAGGYDNIISILEAGGRQFGYGITSFYNELLAMHVDGVWMFYQFTQEAPQIEYGAGLVPYNGNNPKARSVNIVDGSWSYGIPRGAKHPDEAWEWIKYSCAGEGSLKFFKGQYRPSPVKAYAEDPWFAQNNPYWDIVVQTLNNGVMSPITPVNPQIETILSEMVEKVLWHKQSPDSALKDAVKASQKLLDEYYSK